MTTLALPAFRFFGSLFDRLTADYGNALQRLAEVQAQSGAIEPFGL